MSRLFPQGRGSDASARRSPFRATVLSTAVASAFALVITPVVASGGAPASALPAEPPGPVRLTADSGTSAADVALDDRLVKVARGWRTAPIRTDGFTMLGMTWQKDDGAPKVRYRVKRAEGGWERWRVLPIQDDLPAVSEGAGRDGTQLLWIGPARLAQVAILGSHRPQDSELSVIQTETRAADRQIAPPPAATRRTARPNSAPEPWIVQRTGWGANPAWRNGKPRYNWTIKQVHVHHTAGSNSYSKSQVPSILRGIYRYHTHSLGWFDIGYNFLIDKWGRAWVGRSGGLRQPVRGAHTLGFNHMSVGIAVIGNFQNRSVPRAVVQKIIKVSAWKLDKYGRHPNGKVTVTSLGSDRYREGKRLRLPTMMGHRGTNETACPGDRLQGRLGFIRRRTAQRVNNFN